MYRWPFQGWSDLHLGKNNPKGHFEGPRSWFCMVNASSNRLYIDCMELILLHNSCWSVEVGNWCYAIYMFFFTARVLRRICWVIHFSEISPWKRSTRLWEKGYVLAIENRAIIFDVHYICILLLPHSFSMYLNGQNTPQEAVLESGKNPPVEFREILWKVEVRRKIGNLDIGPEMLCPPPGDALGSTWWLWPPTAEGGELVATLMSERAPNGG